MDGSNEDLDTFILTRTLENAVTYEGTANLKAVMGKILGTRKDLRPRAREVKELVAKHVAAVNAMAPADQEARLRELNPEAFVEEDRGPEEKVLEELPHVDRHDRVVMRLAPYPSGALHIGNARMIVLNDYYTKRYHGHLILAYDDTIGAPKSKMDQPGAKFVIPEAYDLIREGLEWLGVEWHETVYKSDRVPLYHEYCRRLLEEHEAYVCTCPGKTFKTQYKDPGKPCPHRTKIVEENLDDWEKMLGGSFAEREAVVRLKSGMDQPDPAVRDQILMRISDAEHPRVGTRYRVWPMLEFSWGIDDHELGITHIIRGADLVKEDFIEAYLWDHFHWPKAEFLHYGRIRFENIQLSKTKARVNIQEGVYEDWTDPRTWSLQSLAKRGIQPEALYETLYEMGLSMSGVKFPINALYAKNQKIIDPVSPRYFFVANPIPLQVSGVPDDRLVARPLVLPSDESRGHREIPVRPEDGTLNVLVTRRDARKLQAGAMVRLKDLFNASITGTSATSLEGTFHSVPLDRDLDLRIIHWVPAGDNLAVEVTKPDGQVVQGPGERNLSGVPAGQVLQFERYGFARLVEKTPEKLRFYFTH